MSADQSTTPSSPSATWHLPTISTTTDGESSTTQSTASGGDATKAITFDAPKGLVYKRQDYIDIKFVLANGVKVTDVTWFVNSEGHDLQKVDGWSGLDYKNPEIQSRARQAVECNVPDIIDRLRPYLGKPMIFSIDWTAGDSRQGNATSPAFSIVQTESEVAEAVEKLRKSSYANSTVVPAKDDSVTTAVTSGTLFTAPALPTNGGNSSGASNVSTVGASHGGHKGGLNTGAVVGIAVGVVVAALLAAALCLFFFLRRRRNKTALAAREDQTRAEQEKLSSFPKDGGGGGANASDAAIAPYRDEHILAGTGSGNARGLDEHDEHAVPLQQPHGGLEGESGSRAAEQTPHGGVSRHLVEDGMTAAEIRRLEEEEAHLDSEIQRAGGRR
ncbi:hypothetical protein LEL_02135 [Akanthomyces lecanii RCEF 1005]|uniref:Uncharacterized protein n=1 Tax=Akanthomyces lecanii RCEF 1005 TaxID=1081108 RepID=A0A168L1R5_CORDF|nr:hypothetical protein LEL_02135 [Akanthomyces lecanii RCEF 1005]